MGRKGITVETTIAGKGECLRSGKYRDLMRKSETLIAAAHRAADHRVAASFYEKSRSLAAKARELPLSGEY